METRSFSRAAVWGARLAAAVYGAWLLALVVMAILQRKP